MTRKDFILLAGIIKDMGQREGVLGDGYRKTVAEHFAAGLAPTNAQFKRDLFIAAATGQWCIEARGRCPMADTLIADAKAFSVWCPLCHASSGKPCVDERRVPKAQPHLARVDNWQRLHPNA